MGPAFSDADAWVVTGEGGFRSFRSSRPTRLVAVSHRRSGHTASRRTSETRPRRGKAAHNGRRASATAWGWPRDYTMVCRRRDPSQIPAPEILIRNLYPAFQRLNKLSS